MSDSPPAQGPVAFWRKWLGGAKAGTADPVTQDSGRCDVCNQDRPRGTGYLLTTAEVVRSPGYWSDRVWHHLSDLGAAGLVGERERPATFLRLVRQYTSSGTPWAVCDTCIGLFPVDRAKARGHAERWFQRSSFAPPGSGAVPLSGADIGDLAAFGSEVETLAAACVLFGIRGSVSRKAKRARKDFKAVSAAVIDQKDVPLIWTILLAEGKCLVDIDLSAFATVVRALWEPAKAMLAGAPEVPRLAPDHRGGALSQSVISGVSFLLANALRLELVCKGCKQSPLEALSPDGVVADGRCKWCKSSKAYLYVTRV
jgi:hypothetical protein